MWRSSSRSSVRRTFAGLIHVRARVRVDLLAGEHRPGGRAAARVADAGRVVADDEHDGVAEILELAQLLEHHGVTQMEVAGGRIEAELDPQRTALASRFSSAPAGSISTALRPRFAAIEAGSSIRPNASLLAGPVTRAGARRGRPFGRGKLEAGPHPPYERSRTHSRSVRRRAQWRRQWRDRGPAAPARRPQVGRPPRRRVRIRKLRLIALMIGLGILAAVSTVFGMMMAVASDLPRLERPATRNSVIYDRNGDRIGVLRATRSASSCARTRSRR